MVSFLIADRVMSRIMNLFTKYGGNEWCIGSSGGETERRETIWKTQA
jgi:hypothetical protein